MEEAGAYCVYHTPRLSVARHGAHHPESPDRLRAIDDQLIANGVMDLLHAEAPLVEHDQLARACVALP